MTAIPAFPFVRPPLEKNCRVIALPYAGGGASMYQPWASWFHQRDIDLLAMQYPGHETRLREPLCDEMDQLVEKLLVDLQPFLDRPFMLFGYSMGGLVAFELASHLRNHPLLLGLGVTAMRPPHLIHTHKPMHQLDDHALADMLSQQAELKNIFEHPALRRLFLPVIRADFKVFETYQPPESPIPVPILCLGADEDQFEPLEWMQEWQQYTTSTLEIRQFAGDHYFAKSHPEQVLNVVLDFISRLPARLSWS